MAGVEEAIPAPEVDQNAAEEKQNVQQNQEEIVENDWQSDKSLIDCIKYIYQNDIGTYDVRFTVGITEEVRKQFSAHKIILSSRSSVFYRMFYSGQDERKDNAHLVLTDCDPRGFDPMLKFVYCDECCVNESDALHVRKVAEKFNMPTLRKKAEECLTASMTSAYICGVLDQAVFYHDEALMKQCLEIYKNAADASLQAPSTKQISHQTLLKLLRKENVILDEVILFEACNLWATEECKRQNREVTGATKREVLDEAIYYIRFPLMSLENFAVKVADSDILSGPEQLAVYRYLTIPDKDRISQELPFSREPRNAEGE